MLSPKIKEWLKILVPDFIAGLLAAWVGAEIKGHEDKNSVALGLGKKIGEKLSIDRGEFLHELHVINGGANGVGLKGIFELFDQLEKNNALIKICDKWYHEAFIIRMLQKIPIKYRPSEYLWLNDLYEKNPADFFSMLEVLNNDEWQQVIEKYKMIFKEKLEPVDEAAKGLSLSVKEINKTFKTINDKARAWALK